MVGFPFVTVLSERDLCVTEWLAVGRVPLDCVVFEGAHSAQEPKAPANHGASDVECVIGALRDFDAESKRC
jgi:hypothetical protein